MTDTTAPKLKAVAQLEAKPSENVIKLLEALLAKAKAGELRAIAAAYEYVDGATGHECAFGAYSNRVTMVGRLQVAAQHIILNEVLEYYP